MNPRRHDTDSHADTPLPAAQPEAKPAKKLNAFDEATKLRAAINKINKREREAAANAAERYRQERRDVLAGASDKAVLILQAAAEEDEANT